MIVSYRIPVYFWGNCMKKFSEQYDSDYYKPILFNDLFQSAKMKYSPGSHHMLSLCKTEKFLTILIPECITACDTIFRYTYQHLSNRTYGKIPLTQIDSVQSQFADHVSDMKVLCAIAINRSTLPILLQKMIVILQRLSLLGGARAVLVNNSLQLFTDIQLFKKFSEIL